MPHIIVKAWPGKTEEQKQRLADAVAQNVMDIFECGADSVSVAVAEVAPQDWKASVYEPDIQAKPNQLYKLPGYKM